MNMKKISALFLSVVMIFTLSACSGKGKAEEKETYNFGGATTLSEVREHFTQGKKITQDFYLTIEQMWGESRLYTEFYRVDEKEVRLVDYDGYVTRFIRDKEKYVIVDDVKKTAAVYPYENTHDDIMWADMDFVISAIDLSLKGEILFTTLDENNKNADDFEVAYEGESKEEYLFKIREGRLSEMTFIEESDEILSVYQINYGSRGGDKSLFDYKGYKVTNMRVEKTDTTTTEE